MLERFTRWWLTKQNNWVAAVLFLILVLAVGGGAFWAYRATGSAALSFLIVAACLTAMFIVFVIFPLALGARYGITPATRHRRGRD